MEAQDEVGQAHDQLFAAPTHEGRGAADERAERRAEGHHHDAGDEGNAAAVEEARQHVSSELVGAEPMHVRGRLQAKAHVDRVRQIAGEERAGERDEDPEKDDRGPERRDAVAAAPPLPLRAHRRHGGKCRGCLIEGGHRATRGSRRA